ncbi:MAG: tRNA uridine-5-carboxymethylaminomethyl(34) synthesis GTPase MnmE [Treponema sp.]|nr:tRNA uridine-5-carboxymethylaminomethyl(34) synthesis GTPase MnmE [Treponema sp.]
MINRNTSYGDDSPIAALATTPGKSALSLIRCSGKGTLECAAAIFSAPEKLLQAAGNTIIHGWIVNTENKDRVDEVLVSVFRGPRSYTGEDSVDISCHGGYAAGQGVMAALRAAGFRDALPGEFTFRAFMNGKLDLTRCESVMELVSAKTEISARHAIERLSGVLENEINAIKQKLVEVLSGTEIFLDYSEDEISASADEIAGRFPGLLPAQETLARLRKLAESWQRERIYQEGILAVIAGRPNAGKSSLFNLLLKEERSIVTEIPGTTRDWIEAWISIDGIPVRLADTAGLRESLDPVEKIGVERSRDLLEAAELILYLIDGTAGITDEDRAFIAALPPQKPLLILWNKADIAPVQEFSRIFSHKEHGEHGDTEEKRSRAVNFEITRSSFSVPSCPLCPPCEESRAKSFLGISAKTGEGVAELTAAITATMGTQVNAADTAANAGLGTIRQKNLVEAAAAALEEAISLANREEPLDLIAPLLREAVNALGEITGEVSTADILEEMFSRFCVGK